jgi:hypothetical protein
MSEERLKERALRRAAMSSEPIVKSIEKESKPEEQPQQLQVEEEQKQPEKEEEQTQEEGKDTTKVEAPPPPGEEKKLPHAWTKGLIARPSRPHSKNSMLFVCDVQENFRKVMPTFDEMLVHQRYVIKACRTLGLRMLVTEQTPFKPTVRELELSDEAVIKKSQFTMVSPEMSDPGSPYFIPDSIVNVILIGIESHVCVLQTALDFAHMGKTVHVVWNAVASQSKEDYDIARMRLAQCPLVVFCSAQSIIYELLGDAKHPLFKSVLQHTKLHVAELGALGR